MKTITINLTDREYVELDLWAKQMRRKPKDQVEHMLSKRVGGARSNIRMDIITSTTYQSKALEKERLDFLNQRIERRAALAKIKANQRYL